MKSLLKGPIALQRKYDLCTPNKETARPRPNFHIHVSMWAIYILPSSTLAWPGWKQHDIPVEVNTARLETSRFKNGFAKCVLLYYPSSEFESTFNAYWNGVEAAGTELSIWEFGE